MRVRLVVALCVLGLLANACGIQRPVGALEDADLPLVVATTNILGDVLQHLAGDQFDVVTIMPAGADPHTFHPSPRDVGSIESADAIIANGASFELALLDAVDAAKSTGTPVFEAITAASPLGFGVGGTVGGAGHVDPHFFTDPARMADVAGGIVEFLVANVGGIDADALRAHGGGYVSTLQALDDQVDAMLASIPDQQRLIVSNHSVFGYFADRYNFKVIGTVVPVGSGLEGVSGRRLADLALLLEQRGISVVFTDASSSDDLARTLATEVGDVAVVSLYTESLGAQDSEGATYVDMIRSNALRISEALAR